MRVPRACLALAALCIASGCALSRRPVAPASPVRPASEAAQTTVEAVGPNANLPTAHPPTDWNLYERVVGLARSGNAPGAEATTRELEASVPTSIWLGRARLATALAFERAGDDASAAAWFESAARDLQGDPAYWARAELGVAETSARLGKTASAFTRARSVRTTLPRSIAGRRARRLAARLARRDDSILASSTDRLAEAELRLSEGDATGARALARSIQRRTPEHRNEAVWIEARSWQSSGDIDRATHLCRRLAAATERPELAAAALYAAARWRWNADDDAAAAGLFADVQRRFPASTEAVAASYALGRIHQTAGRFDEAVAAYDTVRTGRLATDAAWGAAWVRYLAGRWHDAAGRFRDLGATPDSDVDAATYWEARARANVGDPNAMATLQRFAERSADDYYGYMAARYLRGEPLGRPTHAVLARSTPTFPDDLTGRHADHARTYLALGLFDPARRELDALAGSTSTDLLIDAYEAIGAVGRAYGLTRRAILSSDDRRTRRLYPLGHWDVVAAESDRTGIDPLLVLALIRQESAFDDAAVSPADAHGLMQLVPATAADVATDLGMSPPDRWALHTVHLNVRLGTTLLAKLLHEHDGSEIRALAAYNAGDPAVAKWVARSGARQDDEFVELISYAETRRYVKKVVENYLRYRRLYAPSASASSFGSPPNAPFDMTTMTSPG